MAYKSTAYQKAINILERRRENAVLDQQARSAKFHRSFLK